MDITIDKLSPGDDIALAQTMHKQEAALLAAKLEADDDWGYNIVKAPNGDYAIYITDEDGEGLGYL